MAADAAHKGTVKLDQRLGHWLREPLVGLSSTIRAIPSAISTARRPRRLYDLGCALLLKQPRDWERRSQRAFLRAIRSLSSDGSRESVPAEELPRLAHELLRRTLAPVRRLVGAVVILSVAAGLLLTTLVLVASGLSSSVRGLVFAEDLARNAKWMASSSVPGMAQTGLGAFGSKPFFQTNYEPNPHIDLDFGREVTVRRVEVENRLDCCGLSALPLNVEVPEGDHYRLLCQRRAPFATWTCRTEPVVTRYLRLRHPGVGVLHLNRIEVFP